MSIEENIEYQLEKLDQLMATLDISEKDSIKEEPEPKDLEDIIYDFSSDDDSKDDGNFVKIEQLEMGESSGTKREPSYNWNAEFHREFSQAKYQKIPMSYIPKHSVNDGSGILNIDCVDNLVQAIRSWYNKNTIQIQLDSDLKGLSPKQIFNYLLCRTEGNAYKFLAEKPEEEQTAENSMGMINKIFEWLLNEFKGWQDTVDSNIAFNTEKLWRIMNLSICNPCYIENYICEFSQLYYDLNKDTRENQKVVELFYQKLPMSMSQIIQNEFNSAVSSGTVKNTLGARISILRNWMQEQCLKKQSKRDARIGLCCDRIQGKIGAYGCEKTRRKRKYPRRKKFKRFSYDKKKHRKKRFYRRKREYPRKNKTCPKGKKSCTCWLCHETGHYANECPKKVSKEKKQVLNMIYRIGYEPVESDSDSDWEQQSFYELCTDSEDEQNQDFE